MSIFSIKFKIIILAFLAIVLHIILACIGKIEDYEAFICAIGYISIATLLITLVPDKDESRSK